MITGTRTSVGMKGLMKRCDRRATRAADVRKIKKNFEDYIFKKRLPNMWKRPYGRVQGRYGKGSSSWADNAPSTIRQKGFNKPMYSSRGPFGSRIKKSYKWSAWSQRRKRARNARYSFKLTNTREYAEYLHAGSGNYPPRWCIGFIDGDGMWLREHTAKWVMKV